MTKIVDPIIDAKEHSNIEYSFTNAQLNDFNRLFESKDNDDLVRFLGLHQEFDGCEVQLKSYYYIGYRWFSEEDEKYIHISPKLLKDKYQANYLDMFLECLKDPIVSQHMSETYEIFFNEKWIEIKDSKDEITPLIILQFLQIMKNISIKGLKKGYVKVSENLTSKIKGKILINETIKQNHFKNRLDKTVCNHQIFTVDCIENQLLKTALLQCSRNLDGIQNDDISKLLKFNLNSFELVSIKEVFNSDFSETKHSPFYKDYQAALQLAKMIFKRFGFTLESHARQERHKIPPFYINMPELFERYVEVKLRAQYKNNLIPGYGQKDGNSYKWGLRPDFIVANNKMIIDAKYKYWFEDCSDCIKLKDDFQQLSLYGRVTDIRNKIGLEKNEEAELVFIYPSHDKKDKILNFSKDNTDEKTKEKFSNIKKIPIYIPFLGRE